MLHEINLRELAELESPDRAFVSFYGSTEADIQRMDQQAERIKNMLEDSADELEHFTLGYELLKQQIPSGGIKSEGFCAFACYALDFARSYSLSAPVPFKLRIDATPYLRPLARLQDQFEDFLVVAIDNRRTRIYHVAASESDIEDSIRGDVKNHVRKGGWSQQRYSRRRDNQLSHYCKEVCHSLSRLVDEDDIHRVVLVGTKEALAELQAQMPVPLKDKVIGKKTIDLKEGEEHLIEEAYEMFFEAERDEEKQLWRKIKDEYKRDGLAVVGPKEVLQAALNGQVDSVMVNSDIKLTGTRCQDCENVFAEKLEQCNYCQSSNVFSIDLIDELSRRAELTSATVEFAVPPIKGLGKAGGVAAYLRY